jgi:hypothetical protein
MQSVRVSASVEHFTACDLNSRSHAHAHSHFFLFRSSELFSWACPRPVGVALSATTVSPPAISVSASIAHAGTVVFNMLANSSRCPRQIERLESISITLVMCIFGITSRQNGLSLRTTSTALSVFGNHLRTADL